MDGVEVHYGEQSCSKSDVPGRRRRLEATLCFVSGADSASRVDVASNAHSNQ